MLVDDESFVNIIYGETYDKMCIEAHLIPATDPIYGFTGDSIVPRGTIVLMTKMEETPTTVKTPMEFLVVKKSSSYHGVFRRSALMKLETVTYTKFLCIKFSIDRRITIVKENQSGSRACHTNAMRKFVDWEVHVINMEMKKAFSDLERMDDGPKEEDEQMIEKKDPKDLDLQVAEDEPRTSPTDKLKYFPWTPLI
ncbi:Uncharacterized protein Adt_23498 [Abeliophyllum distichum]|uniref:Uncharacterized protein n=1 Tax=Abeliophyllum distichum TaxID=126358 RepID=A0ABD1SDT7_9LAMI